MNINWKRKHTHTPLLLYKDIMIARSYFIVKANIIQFNSLIHFFKRLIPEIWVKLH